jgi:hypothetical protein
MGSGASSQSSFFVANSTTDTLLVSSSGKPDLANIPVPVQVIISALPITPEAETTRSDKEELIRKHVIDNYHFVTVKPSTTEEFKGRYVTIVDQHWNVICNQTSVQSGRSYKFTFNWYTTFN